MPRRILLFVYLSSEKDAPSLPEMRATRVSKKFMDSSRESSRSAYR